MAETTPKQWVKGKGCHSLHTHGHHFYIEEWGDTGKCQLTRDIDTPAQEDLGWFDSVAAAKTKVATWLADGRG